MGLQNFAEKQQLDLVVVDIGSSGFFQSDLGELQSVSTMVGFDPDVRDVVQPSSGFRRAILVPKAVGPVPAGNLKFFLTKNPLCSSLLPPDREALRSYEFQEMFEVEREVEVSATDLNSVIVDYDLKQIDWLKVDAQGADLKLLQGLTTTNLDSVTCVELEPGIINAYKGEDLFPVVQEWMQAQGFWLEYIFVQHYGRYSKATLASLPEAQVPHFQKFSHRSPTAVGVRYLRTLEYLSDAQRPKRQLVVAAMVGLHLGQLGYALEVAQLIEQRFGDSEFRKDVYRMADKSIQNKLLVGQGANGPRKKRPFFTRLLARARTWVTFETERKAQT